MKNFNMMKKLLADGEKPANIARFAIDTVTDVILRTTRAAQEAYPGLPVLCSGGVASNRRLRGALEEGCGAVFAQPQYAADNAMGTAIPCDHSYNPCSITNSISY